MEKTYIPKGACLESCETCVKREFCVKFNKPMTNIDRVREKIIDILPCPDNAPNCTIRKDCYECPKIVETANLILSIKELHVEAQDQNLDYNTLPFDKTCNTQCHDAERRHMINKGFIRCEPKQEE